MELVKVDVEIPSIFQDIEEKLNKICPKNGSFSISGGSLYGGQHDVVSIPDATFPFHESLKSVVDAHLYESDDIQSCLSFHYDALERHEPCSPVFPLMLSWVNDAALEQGWESYFRTPFDPPMDVYDELIAYSRVSILPNDVTIQLKSREALSDVTQFSLGDILFHLIKMVHINDQPYFYARKCANGKHTLSGIYRESDLKGGGFYFEIIGRALKKQFPETFDFDNPDLLGLFSYSSCRSGIEHFFPFKGHPYYLTHQENATYVPIALKKA